MATEAICSLGGQKMSMGEVAQLQLSLMQGYYTKLGIERHEGARQWVSLFSARCRELLEGGVENIEDLEKELYQEI